MNVRFNRLAVATALVAGTTPVAAHGETFTQRVPVLRATPVYTHVSEPRDQCWTEQVTADEYVDRNGVPLGAIVGGITGGVIGNQIGGGTGRDIATVGGAVAGAAIGNSFDRDRAGISIAPVTREVQRCRIVDTRRDVLEGYDVTYRYQNRDFTTRLAYDPGDQLQLRVDVAPQPR